MYPSIHTKLEVTITCTGLRDTVGSFVEDRREITRADLSQLRLSGRGVGEVDSTAGCHCHVWGTDVSEGVDTQLVLQDLGSLYKL